MRKILEIIDGLICRCIGISKQEISPETLNKMGNKLTVKNTESFKRHIHSQKLDRFVSTNFQQMNEGTKHKIGISMGVALAKNLVISFENVALKREKEEC